MKQYMPCLFHFIAWHDYVGSTLYWLEFLQVLKGVLNDCLHQEARFRQNVLRLYVRGTISLILRNHILQKFERFAERRR